MIKTGVIISEGKADFNDCIVQIMQELDKIKNLIKLTFFTELDSMEEYAQKERQLSAQVHNRFGGEMPCSTLVAQKPLQGTLCVEYMQYDGTGEIKYGNELDTSYLLLKEADTVMLLSGGIKSDAYAPVFEQGEHICNVIREIINKYEFPLNNIVRQWNYIPDIILYNNEIQNYQAFNDARSKLYNEVQWDLGYPAATGIGVSNSPLVVDFVAVKGDIKVIPIENSVQIDAHVYSESVLEKGMGAPTTPKFERGKSVECKAQNIVFVSGTASIVGEGNYAIDDVTKQTDKTLDHIEIIVNKANDVDQRQAHIKSLRVYIKNELDYNSVKTVCERRYPEVPKIYVHADVCRDELLVEIEALATA